MFPSSFPCARAATAALALACMAAVPTLAQTPAAGGVPPLQGQGTVRNVCGGIGSDESTAFRAAMPSHPLSLLFAAPGGAYQSDVAVRIADAQGTAVLQLRAGGPVCLIDLPQGSYTVEAQPDGAAAQRRAVRVDGTPRTLDFRF